MILDIWLRLVVLRFVEIGLLFICFLRVWFIDSEVLVSSGADAYLAVRLCACFDVWAFFCCLILLLCRVGLIWYMGYVLYLLFWLMPVVVCFVFIVLFITCCLLCARLILGCYTWWFFLFAVWFGLTLLWPLLCMLVASVWVWVWHLFTQVWVVCLAYTSTVVAWLVFMGLCLMVWWMFSWLFGLIR